MDSRGVMQERRRVRRYRCVDDASFRVLPELSGFWTLLFCFRRLNTTEMILSNL